MSSGEQSYAWVTQTASTRAHILQGNDVRDEDGDIPILEELSSAPATLEALKAVDAIGLQQGYDLQKADTRQTHTQAGMGDFLLPIPRTRPRR